jgi:hypothetical protein
MPPKNKGGSTEAPAAMSNVEVVGGTKVEDTMFFKKISQVK